jgi:transposase
MTRRPDHQKKDRILAALRKNPGANYREIAHAACISSISLVHYYVKKLQDEGLVTRGDYRTHRTLRVRSPKYDHPGTRAKKSAGGRKAAQKARILQKKVAGIDEDIMNRIEKIGRREDKRRKQAHSGDVIFDYHIRRSQGLKCTKLG